MLKRILLLALLFPVFALAQAGAADPSDALVQTVFGLHPMIPLAAGIFWGALKIADTQIKESTKAKWKPWGRKIWDWLLLHVGESRNAGSVDGS